MTDDLWCGNCQTRLDLAAHDAEVAAKARREALEESALGADYQGHLWSGSTSHAMFNLAEWIRSLNAPTQREEENR